MRSLPLLYVALLGLFVAGIALVLSAGGDLPVAAQATAVTAVSPWEDFLKHLHAPLPLLLAQVLVIVAVARVLGWLFGFWGQPAVIGEMIAGILLGPSLLAWVWPEFFAFLFPVDSLGALKLLSQIGILLFMFSVGVDLDLKVLRRHAGTALLVSHASIVLPFLMGSAFAVLVYRLLEQAVPFPAFALFMGVAMSITAFPVLARIIQERQLTDTPLGITAIACAAVDDVTAWCLLALVVALVKSTGLTGAAITVALAIGFIAFMLGVARPVAAKVSHETRGFMTGVLLFVLAASLATDLIGIHALFGAFLAGAVLPRQPAMRQFLKQRLEIFTALLLPLFFAYTGLRTEIGLLDSAADWLLCAGIIGVAIAGKFGASLLAGRITGLPWRDAASLGVLMNTRGLMELIVLNIGYDLGILSPKVFAMMVIMALVTTFMTGPLLSLLARRRPGVDPGSSPG